MKCPKCGEEMKEILTFNDNRGPNFTMVEISYLKCQCGYGTCVVEE